MSKVLLIDTDKRPLDPIHSAQARQLLRNGKAAVFRRFPFTLILKEPKPDVAVQPLRLKIDPGSRVTGIAKEVKPWLISAKGHGTRQSCRTDKHGFPIRHCSRTKFHFGFQTGDIVKAVVSKGKKVGEYVGRIATRATGSFNISTSSDLVEGINHKHCKTIHKKDGYSYSF